MTGRFGECSATCEGTQTEVIVCKQLRRNGDVIDVADNRCPQPKPMGQSRGCPGSPVVSCISKALLIHRSRVGSSYGRKASRVALGYVADIDGF